MLQELEDPQGYDISVNDAFVMGAWNKADGSDDITMLADGNGDFAEAIGLTMDGSAFGLGKRGQRYSMVVNDGVVEQPRDLAAQAAFLRGKPFGRVVAHRHP